MDYIYRKDALTLFNLVPNSPHVARLISNFGSLENAAQAIDDINHGVGNYTSAQKTLLARAITDAKRAKIFTKLLKLLLIAQL